MRILLLIILSFCGFSAKGQVVNQREVAVILSNDSITILNERSRELLDKEPLEAFVIVRRALEAAKKNNFRHGMADAMSVLGYYYKDQANYQSALEYFSAAKKIFTELSDTLLIARSLRDLGGLYSQRALYQEAGGYYQEAFRIAKDKGYDKLLGDILQDLGGLAYYQKDYKKALDYFTQAIEYIDKEKNKKDYASLLNNIGVAHKAAGHYEHSLKYFLQAYDILQQQKSIRDFSTVLMNIGEVQQHLGQLDEAEHYYQRALKAAKKVNNTQRLVEAYDYLAKFYARMDKYDRAYFYKDKYAAYRDTLYRQEVNLQMAEMAKKLQLERKERAFAHLIQDKELQLLNQENKINRLELYRKNNLILISILMVLMAGGVTFILYKGYLDKRGQNKQLAEQNQEISLKNDQLRDINERLKFSEKELKALNETKDKFFGILAHDLRGPLVTLKGFVQILHLGHVSFNQEEMNRMTGSIEHSLRGITLLLDNLLQWSTAQTGTIEFAPRKLKLQRIVEENILLFESTAQVKEIELIKDIGPEFVYGDKQMLQLVFRNLLGNAIKFTKRGGSVSISVTETDTHTLIKVQDTGIGIAPDKLQSLLDHRDHTLKTSRGTENEKGSGLGLWLCRQFVDRHSGSISISSTEGQGTTFTVKLPAVHLQEPALQTH